MAVWSPIARIYMADVLVRPGTTVVEHVGADATRAGLQVGAHLDVSAVTFAQQSQYRFGVKKAHSSISQLLKDTESDLSASRRRNE